MALWRRLNAIVVDGMVVLPKEMVALVRKFNEAGLL